MLPKILIVPIIILLTIVMHEVGHWITAPKGTKFKWEGLNPIFEYPNMPWSTYAAGILWGLIPIICYFSLGISSLFENLGWVGAYIIGSQYDLEELMKIWRRNKCGFTH